MVITLSILITVLIFGFVALIIYTFGFQKRRMKKFLKSKPSSADLELEKSLRIFAKERDFSMKRILWGEEQNKKLVAELHEFGTYKSSLLIAGRFVDSLVLPENRFFWTLHSVKDPDPERIFVLPIAHDYRALAGFITVYKTVPETKHNIVIKPDMNPLTTKDHNIESNRFNWKYIFDGTERKMLTEIFGPVLIEFIEAFPFMDFYFRLNKDQLFLEVRMDLTGDSIAKALWLVNTVYTRFKKSAPTFK